MEMGTAAAFGGAPHQSAPGSEEPGADSFSPRGEALSVNERSLFYWNRCGLLPKGFSLEGGAPRSESIILMIAGGNHTLIPKLS